MSMSCHFHLISSLDGKNTIKISLDILVALSLSFFVLDVLGLLWDLNLNSLLELWYSSEKICDFVVCHEVFRG